MLTARNFRAAMQMLRQLEFALFDRLHQTFDPTRADQILRCWMRCAARSP